MKEGTYFYGKNYKLVINSHTKKSVVDKLVKKYPKLKDLVYDNSRKKSDNDSKSTTESGQTK